MLISKVSCTVTGGTCRGGGGGCGSFPESVSVSKRRLCGVCAMSHKVRTRVRFKDGSEEVRYWDDNSVKQFREAILLAEYERGEDHAGAWQEYREAGWE